MTSWNVESYAAHLLHKNLASELRKQDWGLGQRWDPSQTPVRGLSFLNSMDLTMLQFPYQREGKANLIATHRGLYVSRSSKDSKVGCNTGDASMTEP